MLKLKHLVFNVIYLARDQAAVLRLRRTINRTKQRDYSLLADNLHGLRRVLNTQQHAIDDLHRQLDERDEQIRVIRAEYAHLQQREAETSIVESDATIIDIFRLIQPLLVQLPTIRAVTQAGAEIRVADVLGMFVPLDNMLENFGIQAVEEVGCCVPYDPRFHRLAGQGEASVTPGDMVEVRYVGYRYKGQVLCKADVTRAEEAGTAR